MTLKSLPLICFVFLLSIAANAQIQIDSSPYKIALSFDGNAHDADDIIAAPFAMAMIAEGGLQDRVVHIDYSNHIWHDSGNTNDSIEDQVAAMRNAVDGAASRWNYTQNVFYEVRVAAMLEAAKINFAARVAEAYNAGEQLYYILGGPMEVPYQCIEAVPVAQRGSITAVSHSTWNETHGHSGSRTWEDIISTGVKSVQIADQNEYDCKACTDDDDMSTKQFSKWEWMENMGGNYEWLFNRNPFWSKFDPSDAGMTWWVITGRPGIGSEENPENLRDNKDENLYASPLKVEDLFKNGPDNGNAGGGTIPTTDKIEAEFFEVQSGIQTQATADVGGGDNVGWIENGDWVEYNINMAEEGLYEVAFRVASDTDGGAIVLSINGNELGTVNVPGTGDWQQWITVTTQVELNSGPQVLQLEFTGGNGYLFNINWLAFVMADEPAPPPSTQYFYIVNKKTGKKISPETGSDNAKIVQAPATWTSDIVQWEQVFTKDEYFYLKNRATGKYFRPKDHNDFADILQKPTSYGGKWTQWKIVDTGDGYFHLENRGCGKRIRAQSEDDLETGGDPRIELAPKSWEGNWVRWEFIPVGATARQLAKTEKTKVKPAVNAELQTALPASPEITVYPNPASNYLHVAGIPENAQLQVFDLMGRELVHAVGKKTVDIAALPGGIYLLSVDGKHKQRFLKK